MSCNPCSSPSTPPAPDPVATANAQGQANIAAAQTSAEINRPNINSWNGSQTWTRDPNNPNQWTQTNTLSPAEQSKYDQGNAIQNQMLGILSGSGMHGIQDALNTSYTLPGGYQSGRQGAGANDLYTDPNYGGAPAGQSSLDFSGATAMPGNDRYTADKAQEGAYSKGARYLDSQYGQQEQALTAKLANQGIAPGSEAYKQAMQDFGDQKARDYGNLRDSSIGIGDAEQQADYGRGLSSRQQSTSEIAQQGQFANSARSQAIQEILSAFQGHNSAAAQSAQMGLADQGAFNQARTASLQELAQSKTLPVNILTALMNGSQVSAPSFQPFNNNQQVEAAPLMQAAQMQNQQNIAGQNAGTAQNGQMCGTIGTIAAAAL